MAQRPASARRRYDQSWVLGDDRVGLGAIRDTTATGVRVGDRWPDGHSGRFDQRRCQYRSWYRCGRWPSPRRKCPRSGRCRRGGRRKEYRRNRRCSGYRSLAASDGWRRGRACGYRCRCNGCRRSDPAFESPFVDELRPRSRASRAVRSTSGSIASSQRLRFVDVDVPEIFVTRVSSPGGEQTLQGLKQEARRRNGREG